MIKLHYSLLPTFGSFIGTRPVKAAIDYGAQFTDVTVHFVDESLDSGKPPIQVAIPLRTADYVDSIMGLVFRCGCLSLGAAINFCLDGESSGHDTIEDEVKITGRYCVSSKQINMLTEIQNQIFWDHSASKSE